MAQRAAWAGRRVVVLGGRRDLIDQLVARGAEVHVVAVDPPPASGLASVTYEDPRHAESLARAAARIGAVVDVLVDCTADAPAGRETIASIFRECLRDHSEVLSANADWMPG